MYPIVLFAACFGLLYAVLLGIYRAWFDRLAGVPGPRLARLTRLYEMYYDLVKGGQLPWKLKDLNDRYGQ